MRIFFLVWLGQVVSLLGSKLTEFAMGVWVYQQTGSITQFGQIVLLMYLPNILISPLAGSIIDRWNRRYGMILSDTGAGICTLGVMALAFSGNLQVWHIYIAVCWISCCNAFQLPAYTAAIAQLVSKQNYSRTNGMVQISKAIAKLISPLLAGFLVKFIGLKGILLIDASTFLFALITLLIVRFPKIPKSQTNPSKKPNLARLWQELVSSWNYILDRPGLTKLLFFIAITYFSMGVLEVSFWPFVLKMGSSDRLGLVLFTGGCGMLLGSLAIGVWGGPKRRIYGVLIFVILQGLSVVLGGLRASLMWAGFGIFGYLFAQPFIVSCNQAIWQSKVPLEMQGRIFALQQMLERSLSIVAYIIAGPLADLVFEPAMAENGILANTAIGSILGTGEGRGIALLLISVGLLNIFAAFFAFRQPRLMRIEEELPDAIDDISISQTELKSLT
ncbi:MAG: MFS transporter [Prochloraceae cyanobacterium]|nr:MFS transporter [Prochloraceae cyanobacterium]